MTERQVEDVIILSGDHVYAMDYRPLLRFHRERRSPATVAVTRVPDEVTDQFGIVELNEQNVITGFQEKPETARSNLASMGIYVFRRDTLLRLLEEDHDAATSSHDFGKDIFPRLIQVSDVAAYEYSGYWKDIGTLEAFYDANMNLLDPGHALQLALPSWPIRTPSADAPPASLYGQGRVRTSLVCNGAVVAGHVVNSVLSPGVVVEEGAHVDGAILMSDVRVRTGAEVRHAILDKRTQVGAGARVGAEGEAPANVEHPSLLATGLTAAGKEVWIGEGAVVGRNVCIGTGGRVEAGATVEDGAFLPGIYQRPQAAAAGSP
jgi:glucose-1-phosphate adenylyltransferase